MAKKDFVVESVVVEEEEVNMEINANTKSVFNANISKKKWP